MQIGVPKGCGLADPDALVFVEPFVLFNFGLSDSSLPAIRAPRNAFSFNVYPLSPTTISP